MSKGEGQEPARRGRCARSLQRLRELSLLFLAVALVVLVAGCSRDVTVVGILEADLSSPMEETRSGFLEALRDGGYRAGENARFVRRNAEVRKQPLADLARELVAEEKAALVLALSTEALRAAFHAETGVSVVFAMSGAPFRAGAGRGPQDHRADVTGVIAAAPDGPTVSLARSLLPGLRRLGILFDPAEPDSLASSEGARAAALEGGLEPLEGPADALSAGAVAGALIARGAQALYVTPSETLRRAFGQVAEAANAARVPIFAASAALVDGGALAAYEVDWKEHGRQAGGVALRVLAGERPAGVPIASSAVYRLSLNRGMAQRLGIALPSHVTSQAQRVVG